MASAHPLIGIPDGFRKPGGYAQIDFAQGPATAASGARDVVFVMPMLSTGTWTANTEYRVRSSSEAEAGAGAGFAHAPLDQEVHEREQGRDRLRDSLRRDGRRWLSHCRNRHHHVHDDRNRHHHGNCHDLRGRNVGVLPSGSDVTAIATALKSAINDKSWLPVVATNASGILTLTAQPQGHQPGHGLTGCHPLPCDRYGRRRHHGCDFRSLPGFRCCRC